MPEKNIRRPENPKSASVPNPQGPLASQTPLETRFAEARSYLNPRRQRLIMAMLETPEETFYLSSRELAKRYQVDAATIVRTIQALGYERFADFASDLRRHF
ncbi:MAG TPA: hypothetical protein VI756_27445, partial [Blastocatellia bacterium]